MEKRLVLKSMAVVLLGATLFSCGDDKVAVTKVNITGEVVRDGKVILGLGETLQLGVEVLPTDADQKVTWSTDDNAIVSVTQDGKITGVKIDSAYITAAAGGLRGEVFCYVVEDFTGGLAGRYNGLGSINGQPAFPDAKVEIARADAATLFWSMTLDVTAAVGGFTGVELPEGTCILIMEKVLLRITSENGKLQVNGKGKAKQALMPDGSLTPDFVIAGTISAEEGLDVVITVDDFGPVGYNGMKE